MFNSGTIAKSPPIYTALLHFEGVNEGTTFEDEFNTPWTINDNSATLTAQSKFGSSSLSRLINLSGNSISKQSLAIPETGPFTIDFWIRLGDVPSALGGATIISGIIGVSGLQYGGVAIPDRMRFDTSSGTALSPTGLTNNTWQHVAMERFNGVVYLYLDGIQGTSSTDTTNYNGNQLNIGVPSTIERSYIDEFRYIHNKGVYGGTNFTPRTKAYLP